MFDDHWYHTPEPTQKPRQQELRTQSPARPSLERTRSNAQKKPIAVVAVRPLPEISQAEVPRRPKSVNDLRSLLHAEFVAPTAESNGKASTNSNTLRRQKSRNDLDELKRARYGYGRGSGVRDKHTVLSVESLKDELDFANWQEEFEEQLEDASNEEYRLFHATLDSHLNTCQRILTKTDDTLNLLSGLKTSFVTVETQTSQFQATSSNLVEQQARLQSLADSVAKNLQPFTELEPITRVLARPGSEFVKTPPFREMLVRLDRSLEWMNDPAHAKFPDVETYAPKFRHCMTRALTLIRNYFVASIKDVANEVVTRVKEKNLGENIPTALLYAKFRVNAPQLKELVGEIEKRCGHEEYISLLNECHGSYASVRQRLIGPMITKKMVELSAATNKNQNLVSFARSAISFTRGICLDEFELFHAYFSGEGTGDSEVYNFLETICESLYDYLRPKIIHEVNLVKLCELCSLLQTRYMPDPEDPEFDPYDRSQLDFGQLIQGTLQDTQTRIVFRTQAVIRDEIEGFVPKPDDLDYPTKCQLSRRSVKEMSGPPTGTGTPLPSAPVVVDRESGITTDMFDTEAMFAGWYPTLRKCIWLLSKIYRLVNYSVFDDLAHTIVHATTMSLLTASAALQKSKSSPADAHLFLLRHLLQLRSQIVAFDIEFTAHPDVSLDFSSLGASFASLRTGSTGFSISALFNLVKTAAMPKVVANMLDAKSEIDIRLRSCINDFNALWIARMTDGIQGPSNRLAAADSPDPAARVKTAVEREVPVLRRKVAEYLDDRRVAETLVAAVMEGVCERYDEYYDEMFTSKGRQPRNPSERWDSEVFMRWAEGVFGVQMGMLGTYDGEEDYQADGDVSSRAMSRDGSG
ncbi:Sec34-like family-domain-containing protein [Geopyxis carbonaria]|nr:Sec34-like family-domain-containing protein [Geopyxis carbonaria]